MSHKRIPKANVSPIVSTDEGSMSYPGLTRRRRVYFLRRKVPADLRAKYDKVEIARSLGTQDYSEALRRYRIAMAELDVEFEQRRGSPRDRLLQQIRADIVRPLVELPTDAEKIAHIHEQAKRYTSIVPISRLHAHWAAQAKPTAKTAQEAAKALSALPADVSATEIKKSHIVAARDAFARTGAAGTVAKKLGLIGAVFQAAVDDELFGIVVNPRRGVRVRGAPPEQRAQWTIARLNDVLQVLWQQPEPREDYWLVLGLAFAGSRLSELTGITQRDILIKPVPHVRLVDTEERRLKTRASQRLVPLHPDIADAWIAWTSRRGRRPWARSGDAYSKRVLRIT